MYMLQNEKTTFTLNIKSQVQPSALFLSFKTYLSILLTHLFHSPISHGTIQMRLIRVSILHNHVSISILQSPRMRHAISPPETPNRLLLLLPLCLLLPMSSSSALHVLRRLLRLLSPILIPLIAQPLILQLAEGIVQRMTLRAVV